MPPVFYRTQLFNSTQLLNNIDNSPVVQSISRFSQTPNLVVVGTLMAALGATVAGIGMNLIRSSSKIEHHKPWYCRKRLLYGIALACVINTMLDCVAFAITPLAIVAPVGGVTIVSSVLFARCGFTGGIEVVNWNQTVCILVIVIGVAIVAFFGPHPSPIIDIENTVNNIQNPQFLIYEFVMALSLVTVYAGMITQNRHRFERTTTVLCALAGGMCSGAAQCMMKVLAVAIADYLTHGTLPFNLPNFWIAMGELAIIAVFLLHMLTTCLSSAPIVISSSLYQVCVIIFTITAGCAFYGDLNVTNRSDLLCFTMGVACVIVGLAILTSNYNNGYEKRLISTQETTRDPCINPKAGSNVEGNDGAEAAGDGQGVYEPTFDKRGIDDRVPASMLVSQIGASDGADATADNPTTSLTTDLHS